MPKSTLVYVTKNVNMDLGPKTECMLYPCMHYPSWYYIKSIGKKIRPEKKVCYSHVYAIFEYALI